MEVCVRTFSARRAGRRAVFRNNVPLLFTLASCVESTISRAHAPCPVAFNQCRMLCAPVVRRSHASLAVSAAAKQPTDHRLDAAADSKSGGQFDDEAAPRALPLRRRVEPANDGEPLGRGVEHFMRHV